MKKCFPSVTACHGGFSVSVIETHPGVSKGRCSFPRSLGGCRRASPSCPSAPAKLTPFSSLAPSAMGGFFAIYGWIFAVCSAGCTYFLHLGFLQLMLKRTLTLNQWIYGHRVFLRQFFYLACILFRCGICALRHSHHHARHCWWDSVYTHSPLSHF